MFKKHLMIVALILIVAALVAGCAAPAAPAPAAPTQAPAAAEPTKAPEAEKPVAGAFKMGLLLPGSANDQGWNTMAYNALKQVEKDSGRRGFVRRVEAGSGVVREGLPRFCGAGLPARDGPRQRVRGCSQGGGCGLPERAVLHLVEPAERADGHRVEHGVGPAALPDGRDRGKDVQGGGLRGRHGDPAHLGGADRLHQRRQEREPGFQDLQHVHRQLRGCGGGEGSGAGHDRPGCGLHRAGCRCGGAGRVPGGGREEGPGHQDLRRLRAGDRLCARPGVGELRLELRPGRDQPGEDGQGRHVQGRQERGVRLRHARRDHAELR